MKPRNLATLAAAAAALCGTAQAQTSVTLYGVADVNVEYASHVSSVATGQPGFPAPGGNRFGVMSGALAGSRWGVRGTEDLGGGNKAVFGLESGFGIDTGSMQQNRLFGRQAFVGLQSQTWGTLTFGRQYNSLHNAFADFSPTYFGLQYEPIVALLGNDYRSDNMVKYRGTFGPVTAIAHWSFGVGAATTGGAGNGESPGQFRRDTAYGASLGYSSGPLGLVATFDQYNPALTAAGATGSFRKAGAAASYTVGPAKLMAGYRWGENRSQTDATLLRDDFYWAGVNYQLTAAWSLTVAYYYDNLRNVNGANPKNPWQALFIADYALSKRTDLYLTTAYVKNAGLNFDMTSNNAVGYPLAAGKDNMVGVALGMRHIF